MRGKTHEILVNQFQNTLKKLKTPWEKIDCVNDYMEKARDWDPEDSLKIINEALEWAGSVGYERGIFFLLIHKVYVFIKNSNIKEAEETFEQTRGLFSGEGSWLRETAYFYHSQGTLEMNIGLPEVALQTFIKTVDLAKKIGDTRLHCSGLNSIGVRHLVAERFNESKKAFEEGLKVSDPKDYPISYINLCNNLGYLNRLMRNPDESFYYLKKGIEKAEEVGLSPLLASLNQEIALLKESLGQKEEATVWYRKSISHIDGLNYITTQILVDFGRFLLTSPKTAKEGLETLKKVKSSMSDLRDNTNLLNACRIMLAYYEKNAMDREALRIYRELLELEKDQIELQNAADIRRIERDSSLQWNARLQELIDRGRDILEPLKIKEIFETFRVSAPFIQNSEIALLAEKSFESNNIDIYPYFHHDEFRAVNPICIDDPYSFIAYSMKNNRIIVIKDLKQEARFFLKGTKILEESETESDVQSLLCIPFKRIGKQCVISIQSDKREAYSKANIDQLKGMVFFLGIALDTAEKNYKIAKLSTRDSLTDLYNRREFFRLANHTWAAHWRSESVLSIAILDIDHFKLINDKYGHSTGDDCLIAFSSVLRNTLRRKTDIYARYGGEEFIILFGYANNENTKSIAENIRTSIESLIIEKESNLIQMTVSIGLAMDFPQRSTNLEDLIEKADKALYMAKENGRNRVELSYNENRKDK